MFKRDVTTSPCEALEAKLAKVLVLNRRTNKHELDELPRLAGSAEHEGGHGLTSCTTVNTSCTTNKRAAKSLTALLVLPGKVQQGHYGYNGPVAPVLCYMIMGQMGVSEIQGHLGSLPSLYRVN